MISHRRSAFIIKPGISIPAAVTRRYSRMKYGDPEATEAFARTLVDKFYSDCPIASRLSQSDHIAVASSAYGSIPNAAHALAMQFIRLLEARGVKIELIKIDRDQALPLVDYATLNHNERGDLLGSRKLSISKKNRQLLKGRSLIIVDDLFATGGHEVAIKRLLGSVSEISEVCFLYVFEFAESLSSTNPMLESGLNHTQVKSLEDLLEMYISCNDEPEINARVLRFILNHAQEDAAAFHRFLAAMPMTYCEDLYRAANSDEARYLRREYRSSIELMSLSLLNRREAQLLM